MKTKKRDNWSDIDWDFIKAEYTAIKEGQQTKYGKKFLKRVQIDVEQSLKALKLQQNPAI